MDFPGLVGPRFDPGSVWLVGAGPGDPGLLTLHAAYALGQADVVVHDALVSEAILSLAPQASHEMAGKRAGGVRTQQLRINNRLIQLAREGLRVVRLKGGDPLVFGRGGEEALALAAAGVAFRIVPGISAGIGGTAASGIPLTHRRLARSVAFATGHDSSGDLADVDWAALSRGSQVLVFYMAQRRIGQIAERLIEAGRPAGEPVALISNAHLPRSGCADLHAGVRRRRRGRHPGRRPDADPGRPPHRAAPAAGGLAADRTHDSHAARRASTTTPGRADQRRRATA